ncbi:MAG: class I tRNA ligase family protein [Candidatus Paceibacterota bacterium]
MKNEAAQQKSEVAVREEAMLAFWNERDIFNKSVEKDAPNGDFVFYDGPPFATGLPHFGHILASTIKDAVPRFWTMNGYRVRRQWGWDCHGLPLENLIEKKLGLATKRDIEEYGVKNFNEAARDTVMEYADDWKRIIPRMGRFADMDNDYKTMDSSYTESVWWVFSELNRKGLVYEGFKSMHLCPRCGTTLSNFEVNQGYKDIKDIAVTVKLPLVDEPETSLLVWTTTPWTLPGNMAAAVHEDGDYAKVQVTTDSGSETVIIAKTRLEQLGTEDYEVLEIIKGAKLVGRSYTPPFPYWGHQELEGKENAWKIYHADYVELEGEGTGAVHLAPAYGEEDMELAKREGVPIVHHVDESGHFKDFVTDFAGQLVKPKDDDDAEITHLDADIEVVKKLKVDGTLFRKENVTHSYPHCWRCDTPLLNYATTSWFVRVTDIKDKLVEENSKVHWVPEHIGSNRFGRWLEGARDWAVSRQRYWGAPLPVWRNPSTKEYKVFGSLKELQDHTPQSGNTYFVMRHAEATSNLTGEVSTDKNNENPLTEKGCEQSLEAAKELKGKKIDLIIHSGFMRTRETAEMVGKELGLSPEQIIEDDRLVELNAGTELQGKSWSDHRALYSDFKEQFTKKIDGMENRLDVQIRAGEFLHDIDGRYKDKTILVVGHASSTYAVRCAAAGLSIDQAVALREEEGHFLGNAEVKEVDFVPLPHNDNYELDFHRPYIDEFQVFDEDGTKLERVPDVFDCWFESGSMPYGQHHYPFDHEKEFEKELFPAHFIAESVDQTRGWFYSLMVLGVALFGKSPYQHVITNGLVLAEDGRKLSKKLQNYSAPEDLAASVGADSMRFYLLSSPIIKGEDLNFSDKEVAELQRKNIGRLHNVLQLFKQNATDEAAHADSKNVLDRWIIVRLNQLIVEVTSGFEEYELDRATRPITEFIDDLSVWYIRRSRDRYKGEDTEDREAALGTTRHVLQTLALVIAPSMPFYAEYLWQAIRTKDDVESVHLADWPKAGKIDGEILEAMALTRRVVTQALEARTKAGIKVRQPLRTLAVRHPIVEEGEPYHALIRDEVNVKEIVSDMSLDTDVALDTQITPELKAEGDARELTRAIQDLRKQKGLNPEDRISLTIQTSDSGEELVRGFEQIIKKTVGADAVTFGDAHGDEVTAGGHSFTIEVQKH